MRYLRRQPDQARLCSKSSVVVVPLQLFHAENINVHKRIIVQEGQMSREIG